MRIRTVKPDFWTSGKQLRLTTDAAMMVIALWNQADDDGRLVDDATEIGGRCPRMIGKVEQLLVELEHGGFIHRYERSLIAHGVKRYIQIHDWKDHQRINRPTESTIPKMNDSDVLQKPHGLFSDDSVSTHGALIAERKGRKERKGRSTEETKTNYAEFVTLTTTEHAKLIAAHGADRTATMITVLNNYKGANGKKYKSDYLAILNWVVKRVEEDEEKNRDHRWDNYTGPSREEVNRFADQYLGPMSPENQIKEYGRVITEVKP